MRIFKFGGASVKDANGVKNLTTVLLKTGEKEVLIVVSAMGKMTNAFENIVHTYLNKDNTIEQKISFVKDYHKNIITELFHQQSHPIYKEIDNIWMQLSYFLIQNKKTNLHFVYDQIVSLAEIISTKIISAYLEQVNIKNKWIDARKFIKTNTSYREAKVNWTLTKENIKQLKQQTGIFITQGFIASDASGNSTTLGREGSDYSAAIFAYCLDAESLTVFKDVAGVLNADPRVFNDTILLEKISYREVIEMAFYGASVIHPKTLQPLQQKEIPLFVKSFKNPLEKGTIIGKSIDLQPKTPCFIVKNNQLLISIATRDFSFMMEDNISEIFDLLHQNKLRVNLIQNTAISFSVCLEDKFNNFNHFLTQLKLKYKGLYNKEVTLLTIRHFNQKTIDKIKKENEILLQQTTRETVQFVVKTIKNH